MRKVPASDESFLELLLAQALTSMTKSKERLQGEWMFGDRMDMATDIVIAAATQEDTFSDLLVLSMVTTATHLLGGHSSCSFLERFSSSVLQQAQYIYPFSFRCRDTHVHSHFACITPTYVLVTRSSRDT